MKYLDTETLEEKYLRLKKRIGGYSAHTVSLYKIYLQIKEVDDIQSLGAVEYELYSAIEKDVEAFVFKDIAPLEP